MRKIIIIGMCILLMPAFITCSKDGGSSIIPTKLSAKINGVAWQSLVNVTTKSSGYFFITGTSLDQKILNITIKGTTPGTYTLQTGSLGFEALYAESATASLADKYVAISGTVTLSKVDDTNHKISGTFNFNMTKLTQNLTVTEGVFNDLTFETTGK
jgi:hypothetical protein